MSASAPDPLHWKTRAERDHYRDTGLLAAVREHWDHPGKLPAHSDWINTEAPYTRGFDPGGRVGHREQPDAQGVVVAARLAAGTPLILVRWDGRAYGPHDVDVHLTGELRTADGPAPAHTPAAAGPHQLDLLDPCPDRQPAAGPGNRS